MVKEWNRLSREAVSALSLSMVEAFDNALYILWLGQPRTGQAVGLDDHCKFLPSEIVYSKM